MTAGRAPVPGWRRYLRFWSANPGGDVRAELAFHLDSAINPLQNDAQFVDVHRLGENILGALLEGA